MDSSAPRTDGEIRDGFKFRGGSLALDLAATLAGRRRAEPRDLLATPEDLSRWLWAAGLSTEATEVTTDQLVAARELREALYRLAVARATGARLAEPDRALVNRWAAGPTPAPQLEPVGLSWSGGNLPTYLALVAREGVELFGGPLADRLHQCEGNGCALLFVDTSRSGRRRWCSMAGCGNRAKVAGFRERLREE